MTRIIDNGTGEWLPCMWDDCWRPGHEQNKAIVREPGRTIHYVFCTQRHKMLWVNSHKSLYNLPAGSKGLIS